MQWNRSFTIPCSVFSPLKRNFTTLTKPHSLLKNGRFPLRNDITVMLGGHWKSGMSEDIYWCVECRPWACALCPFLLHESNWSDGAWPLPRGPSVWGWRSCRHLDTNRSRSARQMCFIALVKEETVMSRKKKECKKNIMVEKRVWKWKNNLQSQAVYI